MNRRITFALAFGLIAALCALPWLGGAYALRMGTFACMYAVMALSWTVIGGFAGYPSFATAAFFGFGAYCAGILMNKGMPLVAAVSVAAALAFAGALALGWVLLRMRNHYFAIASLSVAEVLRELANVASDLTGGGMGLNIPVKPAGDVLAEAAYYFWAMWLLLVVSFAAVCALQRSKLGFGLQCIKQNEMAADMLGVNATAYKSVGFAFSGVFVAVAGGIYAAWIHYIEPTDVFDVLLAVKPIVMALLGGLGSPVGAVLGAFAFLGVEELVWRHYLQVHSAVLGLMVVALLLFLPNGLVSVTRSRAWRRMAGGSHG